MVVVVLGMHGSGTSLVAAMLHRMGVDMNPNPRGKVKDYRTNEDSAFMRLNARLLRGSGGEWKKAPAPSRLAVTAAGMRADMAKLVGERAAAARQNGGKPWGWKDPRNCLTAAHWHPLLDDPRYVVVTRSVEGAARSLATRDRSVPISDARWRNLVRAYHKATRGFLATTEAPRIHVQFETLTREGVGDLVVWHLARFVGIAKPPKAVKKAMEAIQR